MARTASPKRRRRSASPRRNVVDDEGVADALRLARAQALFAAAAAAPPPQYLAGLSTLDPDLVELVFAAAGAERADVRLTLAAVAPSWRAYFADPARWLQLDLSPAGGVPRALVRDGLLFAAAARAQGGLTVLNVSGCLPHTHDACGGASLSRDALLAVLAANAASLHTLRCVSVTGVCEDEREPAAMQAADTLDLLRAAPSLVALHADVRCTAAVAGPLLLREPPFGALHVRRWVVTESKRDEVLLEQLLPALHHAAAAQQLTVREIALSRCVRLSLVQEGREDNVNAAARLAARLRVLEGVVELVLAQRCSAFCLDGYNFSHGRERFFRGEVIGPVLARLLSPDSVLEELHLAERYLLSDGGFMPFADALRDTASRLRCLTPYGPQGRKRPRV